MGSVAKPNRRDIGRETCVATPVVDPSKARGPNEELCEKVLEVLDEVWDQSPSVGVEFYVTGDDFPSGYMELYRRRRR
jgi:hypothetical protein